MSTGKVLLGVLAGVAAGALLGILLAPDSGENTRKKIMDKADEYADNMKGKFGEFKTGVSERMDMMKDKARNVVEKAKFKTEEAKSDNNFHEKYAPQS